jgi:hypothetical protein
MNKEIKDELHNLRQDAMLLDNSVSRISYKLDALLEYLGLEVKYKEYLIQKKANKRG